MRQSIGEGQLAIDGDVHQLIAGKDLQFMLFAHRDWQGLGRFARIDLLSIGKRKQLDFAASGDRAQVHAGSGIIGNLVKR